MAYSIVEENCISCGVCVTECPIGAISHNDECSHFEVNEKKCNDCGKCAEICPTDAFDWFPN